MPAGSSVATQKFFLGPNVLLFSEQRYFVWDNASQSTKRQKMLEIWGRAPWSPWLRLCPRATYLVLAGDLVPAGTKVVTPDL